jgi:chromosome partitioning protein
MESAVRKILVASQKGGVGKTTSSINLAAATAMAGARVLLLDADPLSSISLSLKLAEHPQRQTLRQAGIELPGVLVANVLPGLDVLSPYEDGGCSDDDLDRLLAVLATPAFTEHYGCLVVDAPPFLGANPAQLLATCDEFLLVMRAEPMASRTMPAFLELVQRSRSAMRMRGILLTLPEGEELGGRWERELRGRFGARILPQVIPHDQAIAQAVLFNQIVSHAHEEAPASQAYHALVETLALAADARETIERTSAAAALLRAAATVKVTQPARKPAPVLLAPAVSDRGTEAATAETVPDEIITPTIPALREPDLPDVWTPPPAPPRTPAPPTVVELPGTSPPAPSPALAPSRPRQTAPTSPAQGFPVAIGLMWVGLAVVVGVGLRFLRLPEYLIPVLVGIGVTVAVVLLLRSVQANEPPSAPRPTRKPPPRRGESRNDPNKRLSGLKRRVTTAARNVRDK